MDLRQALYELEKQAADLVTTMEIEEKHGPMKAHVYQDMVDESELAGSIAGAGIGGVGAVGASDLKQKLEANRLSGRVDQLETDALLKQRIAAGALTDPARLAQYGSLADEAEAAEAVFRQQADRLAQQKGAGRGLSAFQRRVGAGLVGATALGMGAGEAMRRLEHNRLNREERLGVDDSPVTPALAGTAGAVAGGVLGRMARPIRSFGRTPNGLAGAIAGAGVGTLATDVGLGVYND